MISHQNNMEECIRDLLKRFQLEQYTDTFLSNGYDDVGVIRDINETDLRTMGLTCHTEIDKILHHITQLNEAFTMYMSVHEVYVRPSTDEVLSYIAEKFEQQGIFPSGEECVVVVLEKLEEEGIHLPVHNQTMYITKDGHESTRREYKMLIARYAQELFLPTHSIADALKLIQQMQTPCDSFTPPKPPKPKVVPVYDQRTGRLVWMNSSQDNPNYENMNYIYEFLSKLSPVPPTLPVRNDQNLDRLNNVTKYEDVYKLDNAQTSSQNSSPGPTRPVKKKQTFFKRFKHNLFGKSNASLDSSYLASSTNRSSECSNSKLSFFNKSKSKKEKTHFERQRSHSAPDPTRNLQQIPEDRSKSRLNPTYARPYQHSAEVAQPQNVTHAPHMAMAPPYYQYLPLYPSRDYSHAFAVPPEPRSSTPVRSGTKSDTFSNTSISSSGSVSGDSAYSSKPSLNAIKSAHRPVVYGPLAAKQDSSQAPLNRAEPGRRCPCGKCCDNLP